MSHRSYYVKVGTADLYDPNYVHIATFKDSDVAERVARVLNGYVGMGEEDIISYDITDDEKDMLNLLDKRGVGDLNELHHILDHWALRSGTT
jgi:hypothetical protein